MPDIDFDNLEDITPDEFARILKSMKDKEIREVMGGPHRRAIIEQIASRFPEAFRSEAAKDVDARINLRITGGPDDSSDTIGVVIGKGKCSVEMDPAAEPAASLMMGPVEFAKVITGSGNPVMMVVMGKIKVRGDVALAQRFSSFFEMPKG